MLAIIGNQYNEIDPTMSKKITIKGYSYTPLNRSLKSLNLITTKEKKDHGLSKLKNLLRNKFATHQKIQSRSVDRV